jgi:uncharacterized protein YjbI with pentapeptide repeats
MVAEASNSGDPIGDPRETLQQGRPLVFAPSLAEGAAPSESRTKRTIPAAWLHELVNPKSGKLEQPVTIDHAIIDGPLDLTHAIVERPFAITNSEFINTVTFDFADFMHGVRLDCDRFHHMVSFRGTNITGDLSVQAVRFDQGGVLEDLHVSLVLDARGASLSGELKAQRVEVGKHVDFTGVIFRKDAHFNNAHFGGVSHFDGTHFHGLANFNEVHMLGSAYFVPHQGLPVFFERTADFGDARLRLPLFTGTQFLGDAQFFRTEFDGLCIFNADEEGVPVRFAQSAEFYSCRIRGNAEFIGAQFGGKADFSFCQIAGYAEFTAAQFENEVTFYRSSIAGDCFFQANDQKIPVLFGGKADFSFCQIAGYGWFTAAQFKDRPPLTPRSSQGMLISSPPGLKVQSISVLAKSPGMLNSPAHSSESQLNSPMVKSAGSLASEASSLGARSISSERRSALTVFSEPMTTVPLSASLRPLILVGAGSVELPSSLAGSSAATQISVSAKSQGRPTSAAPSLMARSYFRRLRSVVTASSALMNYTCPFASPKPAILAFAGSRAK